jgi:hypothetical protein
VVIRLQSMRIFCAAIVATVAALSFPSRGPYRAEGAPPLGVGRRPGRMSF